MMADDFMNLLSGMDADSGGKGDKDMSDMLGSLLGGGGGADGLGALLGSLMGGGAAPQQASGGGQSAGAGDMAGLLGSLLGGGAAPQQASGGGAGDLLGSLLGGSGIGALLGGLMGGGGGGGASLPFAGTLAKKLGISEQMASMLIMGAIGLLTSSMAKNRGANRSGEIDFNSLTDPDFIRSSGVSSRLADQMGISEDEAIHGLQQAMELMAAGKSTDAAGPAAKKKTTKKTAAPAEKPATKTTPKKKPAKNESGSNFMDLLDDPNR